MRVFGGAEPVELIADLPGQHAEIAGVDAHRAEFGPATSTALATPGGDVVGVDEQRGVDAERVDLRLERRLLVRRRCRPWCAAA